MASRVISIRLSRFARSVATGMQTSKQLPSFTNTPAGFMTEAAALDLVENEPLLEQLLEVLLQAIATYSLRHAGCSVTRSKPKPFEQLVKQCTRACACSFLRSSAATAALHATNADNPPYSGLQVLSTLSLCTGVASAAARVLNSPAMCAAAQRRTSSTWRSSTCSSPSARRSSTQRTRRRTPAPTPSRRSL